MEARDEMRLLLEEIRSRIKIGPDGKRMAVLDESMCDKVANTVSVLNFTIHELLYDCRLDASMRLANVLDLNGFSNMKLGDFVREVDEKRFRKCWGAGNVTVKLLRDGLRELGVEW